MEAATPKQSDSRGTEPATVEDEDSISAMPQVTAPRQFKFVGAYSRKRRRKKAPTAPTVDKEQPEAPVTPKSPRVSDVTRRPRLDKNGQQDQITTSNTSPLESMGQPPVQTPSNCQMPPPPPPPELEQEQAAMLLHQLSGQLPMHDGNAATGMSMSMDMGTTTTAAGNAETINWADSDGGLMHLFQDASADFPYPFDPMALEIGAADAGRFAMPALFPDMTLGPFNPFNFGQLQFGGSPSTDSSTHTQPQPAADLQNLNEGEGEGEDDDDDYEHGPREDAGEEDLAAYPAVHDDIPLAPLETHPATQTGISHTISQLLTRCMHAFRISFPTITLG
jgi:hypothetical protein